MRIAAIDVFQRDLPYRGGVYRLGGGRTFSSFDATFVRVTADDGTVGWGESTPFGATYIAAHALGVRSGIAEVAQGLLGRDPRHVDRTYDVMDAALVGHGHAKAAIDIACWDLYGKATGMAACDLLGGRTGERLGLISSIHSGDPDDMLERVEGFRSAGYRGHSLKVGDDPALDVERVVRATNGRRPGEYFIVDANGSMSVEDALRFLRLLPREIDIAFEAPCATVAETLQVHRRSDVPIIWDELATTTSSVLSMASTGGAEGLGLKISKSGGLTPARRQRDIAVAAGYTMSVQDTVGTSVSFAAIVHLAQTVPSRLLRCVLDVRDMIEGDVVGTPLPTSEGTVTAPTAPGLGIEVDAAALGDPVETYT